MSAILNAFGDRRAAYRDAYPLVDPTTEQEQAFYERLDAADRIIIDTPASSLAEYAVKLRTALQWISQGGKDALVIHNLRELLPVDEREHVGLFEGCRGDKLVWQVIGALERKDDRASWDRAREAYVDARAAERVADAAGDDANADVCQERRCQAEDVLMAIPSPDAAAFALKCRIAKGDGRETDIWDDLLDAEAKRFAGYDGSRP